jgi:hypothetical protein
METVYGWVVEKINGKYFISAATKERKTDGNIVTEELICHDLSGFTGSWKARKDAMFFQTVSGDATCSIALDKAIKYSKEHRGE